MNITKILVTTSFTCIIAIPAFAQVSSDQKSQMQNQAQMGGKMQKDFKMTKKEFVSQIEQTFDQMDKNHDGILTMDEISGAKGEIMAKRPAMPTPATNDVVEQKSEAPTQTTKPLTPVTGIAPLGR